jgi:hypothetical protein
MSSSSSKKPNELWPLTTTNNPPVCTIDDQDMNSSDVEEKSNDKKRRRKNQTINIDSDLLVDRYHSTQKIDRDNFDALQYPSDDEGQSHSPYSPDNAWQEEDEDEDL